MKYPSALFVVYALAFLPSLSTAALAQKGIQQSEGQKKHGGNSGKKGGTFGKGQDKSNHRESPAAHLPPGFQNLTKDEVKQLDALCNRCLDWIAATEPNQKASLFSIAEYFGSMRTPKEKTAPREDEISTEPRISEIDIGLYVLSRFTSEQRNKLAKLVVDQRDDISDYEQLRDKVLTALQLLVKEKSPEPGFDRMITDSARIVGEKEVSIAVMQARVFSEIVKSITDEQREFLLLVRSNPEAISSDNESIAEVRTTLEKYDERDQKSLAVLAYKAACYCTGTAAQNANVRWNKNVGLSQGRSRGADKEGRMTSSFLNTLNRTQQRQIYQLLGQQVSTIRMRISRRAQIAVALDALKTGEPAVEKKLKQIGAQLAQAEVQAAVIEARAVNRLKESLTETQLRFIEQNILPTRD